MAAEGKCEDCGLPGLYAYIFVCYPCQKLRQEKGDNMPNDINKLKELAERLHARLCRQNHTDGCDWTYKTDPNTNWTSAQREYYLALALGIVIDIKTVGL